MTIFSRFQREARNQNHEQAKELALQIEESQYPETLKQIARSYLRSMGHEIVARTSPFAQALYEAVKETDPNLPADAAEAWLPWRVICESRGQSMDSHTVQEIHQEYEQDFLQTGRHTLHALQGIENERMATLISDFFDDAYYREIHSDMLNASRHDALMHYTVFGCRESSRKPNPIFSNQDFYSLYPWTYRLESNPLYLITRWPEQFPEIVERIKRQHEISAFQATLPWNRPIALTAYNEQPTTTADYQRVLAITKETSSADRRAAPDLKALNIHIVIPDFTPGGGGHMTIFRMVLHLEKAGHQCTLWVKDYHSINHPEGPQASAVRHYQPIKAQIHPLSAHFAFCQGDALIATGWDTVELVSAHKSFTEKFYLVQDYEPFFFPRGAQALQAELTYSSKLKTICASTWLDKIMRERFGRKSTYFSLSYNPSVYYPQQRISHLAGGNASGLKKKGRDRDGKPIIRIAFYARTRTERRAVSLAIEGLGLVNQQHYTLCVELFGEQQGRVMLPRTVTGIDNGILSPQELAELYRSCDIGLTFSATNYALVPQEMMACGLPVIEIDNDSTRAIYPDGVLRLSQPSPRGIAKAIDELAMDPERRQQVAEAGLAWVQSTSWEKSFARVEQFIREEVQHKAAGANLHANMSARYLAQSYQTLTEATPAPYQATVVIPTFNGGPLLQEVVASALQQELAAGFELLIIDSESNDGSIDSLPSAANLSVYRIAQKEFQHGRTRNLAIALAKAPLVAFITQDAIPANEHWLRNLINPLLQSEDVAGVFGRHLAHQDHPGYLSLWMNSHFAAFEAEGIYRKSDNLERYYAESPSWRQFLHYYSDNNSCMRKSVWEESPYPDLDYGEDQLWADWIIQTGKTKAYADDAIVFHSHHYTCNEEYKRSRTEALFFMKYFGYELAQNRFDLETGLENEAKRLLNIAEPEIQESQQHILLLLRAKREGYRAGCRDYRQWLMQEEVT